MSAKIHPSAIVHPHAKLGEGVEIGPGAVIGEDVEIGDRTTVGAYAVIEGWTTLGKENRIFSSVIIGSECQDLKFKGERSYVKIGDRNMIREFVTINRATSLDACTVVGNDNLIMAYSHIAHDCIVGNNNIMANNLTMAGHVTIMDHANLGGLCAIHQYVRIGSYAMIGGFSRITKDIPPYILCADSPLRIVGVNRIGLERKGFTPEQIEHIEQGYRILYRSKLNVSQAIEKMAAEPVSSELERLIQFVKTSERGIVK